LVVGVAATMLAPMLAHDFGTHVGTAIAHGANEWYLFIPIAGLFGTLAFEVKEPTTYGLYCETCQKVLNIIQEQTAEVDGVTSITRTCSVCDHPITERVKKQKKVKKSSVSEGPMQAQSGESFSGSQSVENSHPSSAAQDPDDSASVSTPILRLRRRLVLHKLLDDTMET